jgi:sugar phosphate isomerase/epimerase
MNSNLSRRGFLGASAALVGASALGGSKALASSMATSSVPAIPAGTSTFNGVHIGAITYSWRSMPGGLENVIKYCQESGVYDIELMSDAVEAFLGAPENPMMAMFRQQRPPQPQQQAPAGGQRPPAQQAPRQRPQMTPEQQAMMEKYQADVKKFRTSISMSKVAEAKKLLDNAGIKAHIVKFSPGSWTDDDQIDYAFTVAKALGARGVSDEISENAVKRLAPFADKHNMYAVFHNHMQFAQPGFSYDPFFAVSKNIMANFDGGHYFGSTGNNPCDMLRKYHDRIFSMHIKDKTGPNVEPANTNQVWGQGQMPLKEILHLIRTEKWPIFCDIELEYDVKPWSNAVKEVQTCVNYAKELLMLE